MNPRKEEKSSSPGSISLCMIVKDEEENLARCVASARGLVWEVNVVDTGSTDATAALARRLGANVKSIQWADDFSGARNASLEMARSEWTLILDADEVLSPDAAPAIRRAIEETDAAGFTLPTRNYTDDASSANFILNDGRFAPAAGFRGWVESRKVRLFRNLPQIRFEGRVHELVEPSIRRVGGKIEPLDVPVHHFGYLKPEALMRAKLARMRRLAEIKCKESPNDYKAHYELGVIEARLGMMEDANFSFEKSLRLEDGFAPAHYDLGVVLLSAGRLREAAEEFEAASQLDPKNYDSLYNLAVTLQRLNREREAESAYRRLLERYPADSKALNNLGALYASIGRVTEAEEAFQKAMKAAPECSSVKANLKRLRQSASCEPPNFPMRPAPSGNAGKSFTLSTCFIVKNEEQQIKRAIESVMPISDEIVVIDTGSADATAEVARSCGAKVERAEWKDDFSAARNAAVESATSDWILVIDADEIIARRDLEKILSLSPAGETWGYSMLTRNYSTDRRIVGWQQVEVSDPYACGQPGWFPSRKVRLFRKVPGVRFEGRVHECVEPSILRAGKRIENIDVPVHHYGYVRGRDAKRRYYLELGKRKAEESPANAQAQYELGIQYLDVGEYGQAEGPLERALELGARDERILLNLAIAKIHLNKLSEAEELLKEVIAANPASACAFYNLGVVLEKSGRLAEAEQRYGKALALDPHDVNALAKLGYVEARAGEFEAARGLLERALALDPDHRIARNNLEYVDAKLKGAHPRRLDLTLNMIVRDEERNLREGLAPIAALFDETVVVDTGSSDSTREVAESLGATVLRHQWNDNFAEARNVALRHSKGKWIFWLDADDRLEPKAVQTLRKFIARGTACGVFFPLDSEIGRGRAQVRNYTLRLFPNKSELKWQGAVHEQVVRSLVSAGVDLVNCPDFTIRHVGYSDDEEVLRKNLRNLKLLSRELANRPKDPYILFALAQGFLFCGQVDAAAGWLRELWRLREEVDMKTWKDVFWLAAVVLSDCAAAGGDSAQAEAWLKEAIELSPQNWLAHFLLGERKFLGGDLEAASPHLETAKSVGVSPTILPLDLKELGEKLNRYLELLEKGLPAKIRKAI
ncbi:MAG: glycosyltransferase [Candidatus Abyssobacteria bacterium SURF_5]|uniref:Glycosyltransferase n=1 Tax=Abyssobacteria bacterium (strain SURF_5) TaxID=2093360 RepID=A0A3A4N7V9_ABYX5|nr:MAG: glycosyltransferase [Candidatus Abyssubacteria bacterium SURF_5]